MSALADEIRDEIGRGGPIRFRRFMELALYHPRYGYYRRQRDPFGVKGDFYTNSQLQPVFGRLLAQKFGRWFEEAGRPAEFTIVEMGSGRGETASEIRRCLAGVRCVEVSGRSDPMPQCFQGVVFSNEFFDALPVDLVERRGAGLVEHRVGWGDGGFAWVETPSADEQLAAYIERYAPDLAQGQRIEVNLAALGELERIAGSLERGYLLTIDYGYTAAEIAGGRRLEQGSLMSYEKHQAKPDVLTDAGNRDITSHVNFTALERRGAELGLESLGLESQAIFLTGIGRADEFQAALAADGGAEGFRLRMQLKSLLFGMGETFRVLVQRK